jgi:hypothetical protein
LRRVAEYFGKEAEVSAYYCQGGKKMLVFAVLSDKSGITHDNETTVVVHRSEHQLVSSRRQARIARASACADWAARASASLRHQLS